MMSSEKISTRERILKATWKLLEDRADSQIGMADIAKAAGVSRQSVYLHFANRAELLVATTRYLDTVYDIETKLEASRQARTGEERLEKWVEVWGNHIPRIFGVASALMAMMAHDEEARAAWEDRMGAVRHGCEAVIDALIAEGKLTSRFSPGEATDFLWALQSVGVWEQLRKACGWSQRAYITHIHHAARQTLVKSA